MTLTSQSRRTWLKASAAGFAAASLAGSLGALYSRRALAAGAIAPVAGPFGPLAAVNDLSTGLPLLQLPAGFSYRSFGWTGDLMTNGEPCPAAHDGMAVILQSRSNGKGEEIVLIRNHELGLGGLINAPAIYDAAAITTQGVTGRPAGGNTVIRYRDGQASVAPALGGTIVNCAGGPTPWGTWLTCEEASDDFTALGGKKHGYVFEVAADPAQTSGRPIVAMGRMDHEAAAVDPKTGYVYLTEDDRNKSGLYRFIPNHAKGELGSLERGGRLQAAKVRGAPNVSLLTPSMHDTYSLEWVDIAEPDAPRGTFNAPGAENSEASGPFLQAYAAGALRMSRGEGIWYHRKKMYIVDTSAGIDARLRPGRGEGAVWELDLEHMTLKAILVSDAALAGNNPDNITVSPRGQILLCEDGGGVQDEFGFGDRLMGLTPAGETFIVAKNNIVLSAGEIAAAGKRVSEGDYRGNEFAGACFDRKGETLFVNIQTPGVTFAITGPWRNWRG